MNKSKIHIIVNLNKVLIMIRHLPSIFLKLSLDISRYRYSSQAESQGAEFLLFNFNILKNLTTVFHPQGGRSAG
jgi:hypothetical protein